MRQTYLNRFVMALLLWASLLATGCKDDDDKTTIAEGENETIEDDGQKATFDSRMVEGTIDFISHGVRYVYQYGSSIVLYAKVLEEPRQEVAIPSIIMTNGITRNTVNVGEDFCSNIADGPTSVRIYSGVELSSSFVNCTSLTKIHISKDVRLYFGGRVKGFFSGCKNVKEVILDGPLSGGSWPGTFDMQGFLRGVDPSTYTLTMPTAEQSKSVKEQLVKNYEAWKLSKP